MKTYKSALIALCVLVCGCKPEGSTEHSQVIKMEISNVTAPQVLLFKLPPDRHPAMVSGLSMQISGNLDGTAYVYAVSHPTQWLSGTISVQTYDDWSGGDCVLHYVPETVNTGKLVITCRFH